MYSFDNRHEVSRQVFDIALGLAAFFLFGRVLGYCFAALRSRVRSVLYDLFLSVFRARSDVEFDEKGKGTLRYVYLSYVPN